MAREEDLDGGIWDDPDFEPLGVVAKALYIWSWSNRRCGLAGIYKASVDAIASHLKAPREDVIGALRELEEAHFVYYEAPWLWVRTRVKRLRPATKQMATGVARDCVKLLRVGAPFVARAIHEVDESTVWWSCLQEALDAAEVTVTRPSPDGHPTITTPSGDGQTLASVSEKSDGHPTLTRPSPDGARRGRGEGSSTTGVKEKDGITRARPTPRRVDPDSLPKDFPAELVAAVDAALPVLQRLHEERACGEPPTRRGIALSIRQHPERDVDAALAELERWVTVTGGAGREVRDWPRTFGNFLAKAPLAAPKSSVPATPRPGSKNLNRFMERV